MGVSGSSGNVTGAAVWRIEQRTRSDYTRMASTSDFVLRESHDADAYATAADNPDVTPYCLDHDNQRMVFAQTGPATDLSAAPFYYQGQFETASRLIALPYERVHELAAQVPRYFDDLTLIYSVGRCGSTLVSRMWHRLQNTLSLSEPDVFTEVSHLRVRGRLQDGQALQLLESALRLLHRGPPAARRLVIKFRAQCIEAAALMQRVFPACRLIFVYRGAVDCIDSHVRVFDTSPMPESEVRKLYPFVPQDCESYRTLGRLCRPVLGWTDGVLRYLALRAHGVPIVALRYEDVVSEPQWTVMHLFDHCGVSRSLVEVACTAMGSDSQAGTPMARRAERLRAVTESECEGISRFLRECAGLTPDVVLPGTLGKAEVADRAAPLFDSLPPLDRSCAS